MKYCEIYNWKAHCYENFLSNFKLLKHRRILLYCFRYRIWINDKNVDIFKLSPLPLFCFLLLLHGFVLIEIIASVSKNSVVCGTELRLQISVLLSYDNVPKISNFNDLSKSLLFVSTLVGELSNSHGHFLRISKFVALLGKISLIKFIFS